MTQNLTPNINIWSWTLRRLTSKIDNKFNVQQQYLMPDVDNLTCIKFGCTPSNFNFTDVSLKQLSKRGRAQPKSGEMLWAVHKWWRERVRQKLIKGEGLVVFQKKIMSHYRWLTHFSLGGRWWRSVHKWRHFDDLGWLAKSDQCKQVEVKTNDVTSLGGKGALAPNRKIGYRSCTI